MMIAAEQMRSLPEYFSMIQDPRRKQGRRHSLSVVLAIAAAATLCGMCGYKAIFGWAKNLGQKARERFGCRREKGRCIIPSMCVIRDVLVRVDPVELDNALQKWNEAHDMKDVCLAYDGKTLKNAIDEDGRQTHIVSVVGHDSKATYTQKKVGTLPVAEDREEAKRTNEIGMFIPTFDQIDIDGKTITADALLTQKKLATYIVGRGADYLFTVKGNQGTLLADVVKHFENRQKPEYATVDSGHGRIDTRSIWTTADLNEYVEFPHVGQAFCINRKSVEKKTGKISNHVFYGITSKKQDQANPEKLLKIHRGHWTIENSSHHILDSTFDEDKSTIRTGHGPANTTRLRRFAIGLLKSRGVKDVAQKLRDLHQRTRTVFDYLGMTKNCREVLTC